MHADRVTYEKNGDRHIYDMRMAVWEYDEDRYNNPNDDKYKKKLVHIDAYGAVNTKILVSIALPIYSAHLQHDAWVTQTPWGILAQLLWTP